MKPKDYSSLIGDKFGRLTLVKIIGTVNQRTICLAECECGTQKQFRIKNLLGGNTTSCGCARKDVNKTHGYSATRLYHVWFDMKSRCYKEQNGQYHNYGQRGIKVCPEWLDDVRKFIKWGEENGYKQGMQIDRIDVNGDYEPSNCRWVTPYENSNNKRTSVKIEINGVSKPISQWAKEAGLRPDTFHRRIRLGWTPEEALRTPKLK